ncbi:MAG: phosphoethanolamine transferase [Tannerella sp.]|nr:phosphoethanolamine transferase [Tannerella sp.]
MQLFFLGYILLLVPLLSLIAQNIPVGALLPGILVSFGLLVVIFMLSSFMTTKGIRIFYSALLAITLVPGAVLLGYLLFAKVLLSDGSITTLFETNAEESKEFIAYYMSPWVTLGISLYILCPVVMICKMKHIAFRRITEHRNSFIGCVALLLLFLAIEPVAQRIYFVDFYRIFANYKIRTLLEDKTIADRQARPFRVTVSEYHAPHTLVLVIGESLSRHHMSLYGYERDTNPLLSAQRQNLKVYRDVISPQVHTIPVIRSIFTFADHAHPEYLTERPSLFELFNRAGYETFMIDNQPLSEINSSYEPLLKLADHAINLSDVNQPDEIVLSALQQALKSDRRKLIVIHLMGSHAVYKFRYPASFERFDYRMQPLAEKNFEPNVLAQTTTDQYDNSVLYNDYVISSMIKMLESSKESAAMVYFSDHGEEVYDFRDFAGHVYEKASVYMCEIPLLVWMSESFRKRRKDLVFDESRPYSTADMLYSLSDIAGMDYKDFDRSRSLFSAFFTRHERQIGEMSYYSVQEYTEQERNKPALPERWAMLKERIGLPLRQLHPAH